MKSEYPVSPLSQFNVQIWFFPQDERLLVNPVLRLLTQLHIEVPNHSCQDGPHFGIGQVLMKGRNQQYIVCPPKFYSPDRGSYEGLLRMVV